MDFSPAGLRYVLYRSQDSGFQLPLRKVIDFQLDIAIFRPAVGAVARSSLARQTTSSESKRRIGTRYAHASPSKCNVMASCCLPRVPSLRKRLPVTVKVTFLSLA